MTAPGKRLRWVAVAMAMVAVGMAIVAVVVLAHLAGGTGNATPGRGGPATRPAPTGRPPLRIGLIPERDVFKQRQRYRALADYLAGKLARPVQLVTANTYEAILLDYAEKKIDGAFLGSLVAVLAMDRHGARPIARPELAGGVSTYRGVIFVRADSKVRRLDDLAGHSVGMVRTTTAANLFPGCLMARAGLLDEPLKVRMVWMGTHDDVVRAVTKGEIDIGSAKDLRLHAVLQEHPDWKIRRLALGQAVPENALLVRADLDAGLADRLTKVLLGMGGEQAGLRTLSALGVVRFIPCKPEEYQPVYDMVECVGPDWTRIGLHGEPPRNPAGPRKGPRPKCYVESF